MNNQFVYNIEILQSYYLIYLSSGFCVSRVRQCSIEASRRRKRAANQEKSYELCEIFIAEANKAAERLIGYTTGQLIPHAREACVADILSSNSTVVSR